MASSCSSIANFVNSVIDDKPHQSRNFSFPLHEFGVQTVINKVLNQDGSTSGLGSSIVRCEGDDSVLWPNKHRVRQVENQRCVLKFLSSLTSNFWLNKVSRFGDTVISNFIQLLKL